MKFKRPCLAYGKPEEFLFFVRNFNMTLNASGTLAANAELRYLHHLLHGEALRQFDNLCDQLGSMTVAHFSQIILGLGKYFFFI